MSKLDQSLIKPAYRADLTPEQDIAEAARRTAELMAAIASLGKTPEDDVTVMEFYMREGRYPNIEDARKPWTYKGFLLPYIWEAEQMFYEDNPELIEHGTKWLRKKGASHFSLNRQGIGRWEYWHRMQARDGMIDLPIPQIHIAEHVPDSMAGLKMARKIVEQIDYKWGYSNGVTLFIEWLAWGCGVAKEPPKFSDEMNELCYREFDASVWLNEPADYLGRMLSDNKQGKYSNPTAFFPTPASVVKMMAAMTFGDPSRETGDRRSETVMDPCCGTGIMLLVAGGYSLRLYGCDILGQMAMATRINGAFFCPWLAFGLPDRWFEKPGPTIEAQAYQVLQARPELQAEPVDLHFTNGGQASLFGEMSAPKQPKPKKERTNANVSDQRNQRKGSGVVEEGSSALEAALPFV